MKQRNLSSSLKDSETSPSHTRRGNCESSVHAKNYRVLSYLTYVTLIYASLNLVSGSTPVIDPTIISDPIKTIACTFAKALIWIAAALAVLVFALAGVKWIYAQDDASKRKTSRDTMIHCVMGLIIITLANQVVEDLKFVGCGGWGAW